MYKRTIWQDHVEGVQTGTDMSAANFNNLEAGVMEANALMALTASYRRYDNDVAKNSEAVVIDTTIEGNTSTQVAIPENATRNNTNYNVVAELHAISSGSVGNIVIETKQANGFTVNARSMGGNVGVRFIITGGMI